MTNQLSEGSRIKLELACTKATASMFAFFCNEQNRGESFAWSEFPSLCERFVPIWVDSVFVKPTNQHHELAKQITMEFAKTLLKECGEFN